MDTLLFWATILSPIIGVIAIIVALIVSHSSTKKAQQQINAIYDLLNVFVAAQTPTMIESKRKYEQQLSELDELIKEQKENMEIIHNPFLGQGPLINMIEESCQREKQYEQLTALEDNRKNIQKQINLIQTFFDRVQKSSELEKMYQKSVLSPQKKSLNLIFCFCTTFLYLTRKKQPEDQDLKEL